MVNKDMFCALCGGRGIFKKAVLVGVAGNSRQLLDMCIDRYGFAEKLDLLFTLNNGAAESSYRLVSHEKYGGLGSPEIVL